MKYTKETISFKPTPQQLFELENIAKEYGVKKSVVIRMIIDKFLDEYENTKLAYDSALQLASQRVSKV